MARTNQDAITPIEASNDQATSSGGQKEEVSLHHEHIQNIRADRICSLRKTPLALTLLSIQFLELEEKSVPSHGLRLIVALQNLLFTSGFTLPAALEPKSRVSFVIW